MFVVGGAGLFALDVNGIRSDMTIMRSLLHHEGAVIVKTRQHCSHSPALLSMLRAVRVARHESLLITRAVLKQ